MYILTGTKECTIINYQVKEKREGYPVFLANKRFIYINSTGHFITK